MSKDYCRGCGTPLQSVDQAASGYIPEAALMRKGSLICKRCYEITHYGKATQTTLSDQVIREKLKKASNNSDLLLLVADFTDLTGTLPLWKEILQEKPYILALNKSDLIPERTKPEELLKYLNEYLESLGFMKPKVLHLVSGLKGRGIDALKKALSPYSSITIMGAANVGKSSLIKQLLAAEEAPKALPTVSKFPGTTQGLSTWKIFNKKTVLTDTPGLTPGNRMGDLFCLDCAALLLPEKKMGQKLWGMKPHKALLVGGILGIESLADREIVLITFLSQKLQQHRTSGTRVPQLLETRPEFIKQLCGHCQSQIKWQTEVVSLAANQDLGIAGLGWFSLRGESAKLQLTLPQGVYYEIRPALIGKKD